MKKNTCWGCQERKLHCHSTCEKYKKQREYNEKIREERKRECDFYDYTIKTTMNNKGFGGERRF